VFVGLAFTGLAATIAVRNYRAARNEFEADPPSRLLDAPQSTGIAAIQSVSIESPDGFDLSAWYAASTNRAAVVVVHGTNSDRASMLAEIRLLARDGYGVLAFDWPGLGRSGGHVRWDGQARRALTAAIDWVSRRPDVDPARIGGLGFSMGAYVMAQVAAADSRLRAVVLEAPPSDFTEYIRLHNTKWGPLGEWPAAWAFRGTGLLDQAVAPVNLVKQIAPRPVLFLGGSADREISPQMVMKLYALACAPKAIWIVPGAHHGDYSLVAAGEYERRLSDFYARELGSLPRSNIQPPGAGCMAH
jgi:dipeptidyl aminopeptidase/acylaminoacyl peptidase